MSEETPVHSANAGIARANAVVFKAGSLESDEEVDAKLRKFAGENGIVFGRGATIEQMRKVLNERIGESP